MPEAYPEPVPESEEPEQVTEAEPDEEAAPAVVDPAKHPDLGIRSPDPLGESRRPENQ